MEAKIFFFFDEGCKASFGGKKEGFLRAYSGGSSNVHLGWLLW